MQPRPPRIYEANDVLTGRVNPSQYPFKLIYLVTALSSYFAGTNIHPGDLGRVDALLSAAELLEQRGGWRVVGVDSGGKLLCLSRQ
jgi:hypothetical protein